MSCSTISTHGLEVVERSCMTQMKYANDHSDYGHVIESMWALLLVGGNDVLTKARGMVQDVHDNAGNTADCLALTQRMVTAIPNSVRPEGTEKLHKHLLTLVEHAATRSSQREHAFADSEPHRQYLELADGGHEWEGQPPSCIRRSGFGTVPHGAHYLAQKLSASMPSFLELDLQGSLPSGMKSNTPPPLDLLQRLRQQSLECPQTSIAHFPGELHELHDPSTSGSPLSGAHPTMTSLAEGVWHVPGASAPGNPFPSARLSPSEEL